MEWFSQLMLNSLVHCLTDSRKEYPKDQVSFTGVIFKYDTYSLLRMYLEGRKQLQRSILSGTHQPHKRGSQLLCWVRSHSMDLKETLNPRINFRSVHSEFHDGVPGTYIFFGYSFCVKYFPEAYVFEQWVTSWSHCLSRLWNLLDTRSFVQAMRL